jgi:hypothetical protein
MSNQEEDYLITIKIISKIMFNLNKKILLKPGKKIN